MAGADMYYALWEIISFGLVVNYTPRTVEVRFQNLVVETTQTAMETCPAQIRFAGIAETLTDLP